MTIDKNEFTERQKIWLKDREFRKRERCSIPQPLAPIFCVVEEEFDNAMRTNWTKIRRKILYYEPEHIIYTSNFTNYKTSYKTHKSYNELINQVAIE